MRRLTLILAGLVVAFGLWWYLASSGDDATSGVREAVGPSEVAPPPSPPPSSQAPSRPSTATPSPAPEAEPTPSPAPAVQPAAAVVAPSSATRRPRWGVGTLDPDTDQVEEDPPMIWGTDKDGIQGAVASKIGAIKECYEGWLKAEPELTGRLKVRFTIGTPEVSDALAAVVGAEVLDTELDHVWMEGCVLNSLDALVFERPEGGRLNVIFPFAFAPSDDADPE